MTNGTPQLGVKAVFDDAEAQTRMAAYTKRMKRVQSALDEFAAASVKNNKKMGEFETALAAASKKAAAQRADAAEKASKAQIQSLTAFRRQLITVLFFLRFFTQAVRFAWNQMVEGVETRAMILGVRALASAYGHSLNELTQSMSETAGSLVDDANNIAAAQAGLLADHGRFVANYDELWQAARVAAVTAGGDAIKIFGQLVEALDKADGALADTASGVFNVELAMLKFATSSGRTRDELSSLEKRQVILNEVQRVTNALLESGAQAALDATVPVEELKKAWNRFALVLGVLLEPLTSIKGVIDTVTKSLIIFIATLDGVVAGVKELVLNIEDLLILPPAQSAEIAAGVIRTAQEAFNETVRQLNEITFGGGPDPTGAGVTGLLASVVPEDADLEDELRRYEEFLKRIHGLRDRAIKEMETLELRYTQRLEELEIMRQQRLEEIFIKAQRKRQDLMIRLQRALADADRDYLRGLERLEQENARRRERIWQRYWEAVRRINRKFSEDIYDAIANRDATAALKAIRRRRNDLEDAAHNRNIALQNLRRDNEAQIEELRIRRERAREDALRAYQQGLEDLARWIQQEQADLERHLAAQRLQIENWHNWRLQAIAEQFRLEYLQALAAYTGQESLLADHVARMNAIWASMLSSLNLPPIPPPPGSSGPGRGPGFQQRNFADGGAEIFSQRTNITVGEGSRPELVVAIPLGGQNPAPVLPGGNGGVVRHDFSGIMEHRVDAVVRGALAGIEAKVQAALVDTLQRLM